VVLDTQHEFAVGEDLRGFDAAVHHQRRVQRRRGRAFANQLDEVHTVNPR
jgi:hypothetical protein